MSEHPCRIYEDCPKANECFPLGGERTITFPHRPEHKPIEIMIVGQGPSTSGKIQEKRRDALRISGRAKYLRKCLEDMGLNVESIYFTNLVKCSSLAPRKEGKPTNCYRFLCDEIERVNPKRILVLGTRAKRFLEKKHAADPRLRFAYHPAQRKINREAYTADLGKKLLT